MKKIFDDLTIKNLRPTDTLYVCMAEKEPGFGIRVYPSGSKAFFYQYKVDGQRRFMTLGDYPSTSLKTAREQYQAEASKVKALRRGSKDGVDPVLANKRERERRIAEEAEHQKALTVADLVKEYIEKHAKIHKRSWQEDERILNKEVTGPWGKRKAVDIKKRDVVLLLESIMERGAPGMSNNTFQVVRKMFNFAVERDILPYSPATGIKALAPKLRRDRVLSVDEIKKLWGNLDSAAMSNDVMRALKLVLVTGQRPGEVTGMHTGEIDGHWWTIPVERSKNKNEHRVYLTDTALVLIGELTVLDKETKEPKPKGFIFPSPLKNKEQPITPHSLPVAVMRNMAWPFTDKDGKVATKNRLDIDQFTPHDLRRTAATFIASMGYSDEIIDAVLNHVKQGIIRTYNRHGYHIEKQKALEAWERKLLGIISGKDGKVLPLIKVSA